MDTGINIMDLGLNEFRLDLLAYIKNHPDIEHAPFGMSAVVGSDSMAKPGVMYILRNRNNAVNIDKKNMLHPFYMVYVGDDGEVVCDHLHPKQLLDVMRMCARASRSMTARSAQPSTRRRRTDATCANTATCCTVPSTAL